MNKRKGNIVAIALLTIVISISGCITAFAGETTSTAEGTLGSTMITWSISDDVLTISGEGAMPDYISSPWKNYSFSSVVIEEGVTCIGDSSFDRCTSLTKITIPNTVERIGHNAFSRCSKLTSISVPNSVKSIDRYAFSGCSKLTSITIPGGITSIESGVFSNCSSLAKLVIPSSVTSIGEDAFLGCGSLISIEIPRSVTSIGNSAFARCSSLLEIEIPGSVESIGESAFSWCESLTSIDIPDDVTTIGSRAFSNCYNMDYFWIPEGVETIGRYAFNSNTTVFCAAAEKNPGWDEVWTNGKVYYGSNRNEYKFWNTLDRNASSLSIPDSVTRIPERAFENFDKLKSINIPGSVQCIESYAFRECISLTSIIIPDGIATIESGVFSGCESLTSIEIPISVTSIGEGAFSSCRSLKVIDIPDSVKSIGEGALRYCTNLKYIWIPNSVETIGRDLLGYYECEDEWEYLNSPMIFCEADSARPGWDNNWISRNENVFYSMSKGIFDFWATLTPESKSIELPENSTVIPSYAFENFNKLESIVIPDTVTRIGSGAFLGCERLKTLSLPEGVTEVSDNAFRDCLRLESINLPSSLTRIGVYAFDNCISLSTVQIPGNVKEIDESAFMWCTKLKEITIPEGVESVGDGAFSGCYSLEKVKLPSSLKTIGYYAFAGCRSLTKISIPEGVKELFGGCLQTCSKLKNVEILGTPTIDSGIFNECTGKISIYINPGATMYIHEAIDNPNVDIYTSASSFPDTWGVDSSAHYGKIFYNTSLESFQQLMANNSNAPSDSGGNGQGSSSGGSTGDGGSAGGSAGGGGGGSAPSEPEEGNTITNSGNGSNVSTDVDVSDSTLVIDDTAVTKIDSETGSKIIDNAIENKSSEVIIMAETKAGDASSSTVALPASTLKALAEQTSASVTVNTDSAKVTLDDKALDAISSQAGTSGDIKLMVETREDKDGRVIVELKIMTSNGAVSDFNDGNATVTVPVNEELAGKKIVCVYIDENGKYTKMEGELSSDGKSYTFKTGHFSTYAILEEAEADAVIDEQNKAEVPAVKVARASVKLKAYKGGKFKVTASAKNATGYRVYYKKSTWKKYKTYTKGNIKTLNKTFKKLSKGKYTVKVKAFHKADDGKTTWGADSSIKKITVR